MSAHISATSTLNGLEESSLGIPTILRRPLSFITSWSRYWQVKETFDRLSWGTWNEALEAALVEGQRQERLEQLQASGYTVQAWEDVPLDDFGLPLILQEPGNAVAKRLNQLWQHALMLEARRTVPFLPIPSLQSLKLEGFIWLQQHLNLPVHVQQLYDAYTGIELDTAGEPKAETRFAHFSPIRPSIDAPYPCAWHDGAIRLHLPYTAILTALILNYFKFRSLPSMFAITLILLLKDGPIFSVKQRRITVLLIELFKVINWGGNNPCQWIRRMQLNEAQTKAMLAIDGYVQDQLHIRWTQETLFDRRPPPLTGTCAAEYIQARMDHGFVWYTWNTAANQAISSLQLAGKEAARVLRSKGWNMPLNKSGIPSITLHNEENVSDMARHFAKLCACMETADKNKKWGEWVSFPGHQYLNRQEAIVGLYLNALYAYFHEIKEKGILAMANGKVVHMTSFHKLGFPMEVFPGYGHFGIAVSASRKDHSKPHKFGFSGIKVDDSHFSFDNWFPEENNVVFDATAVNHSLAAADTDERVRTAMDTLEHAARNFGDLNSELRRAVSVEEYDTSVLEATIRRLIKTIASLKPVRPGWMPRIPPKGSAEARDIAERKARALASLKRTAAAADIDIGEISDDEEF